MLKTDLHTHTIASGHAYSTVLELATFASQRKVEVFAITDHGPSMVGAPHAGYFGNIMRIPNQINDVMILRGCEANIIDYDGKIDIEPKESDRLDILLAGIHELTPYPVKSTRGDNTRAIIKAIEKNTIHIVSHPFRPGFPIDIAEVFKAATDNGTLLELNLYAILQFQYNIDFMRGVEQIIELVERNNCKIVVSSDAHVATEIGDDKILKEINLSIPSDLILGAKNGYNEVKEFLKQRK